MKKLIFRLAIAVIVIIVLAVIVVALTLDSSIKKGVETIGPKITKVDVKLDAVSLSLLRGSCKIKGLVVGNPAGYKTAQAIGVGSTSVSVSPGSLLSDKIVVRSIRIEAPQITYELGPGGNNLKRIQANVAEFTGGSSTNNSAAAESKEAKSGKKLQVDEVVITGGKVTLGIAALGGKAVTVALPDIRLAGLGSGPDGITPADLAKQILTAVADGSVKVAATAVTDLGKGATDAAKDAGKTAADSVGKTTKSLGDLFKKKQ